MFFQIHPENDGAAISAGSCSPAGFHSAVLGASGRAQRCDTGLCYLF